MVILCALATRFAFIVKGNWKNMYFHPKMVWPHMKSNPFIPPLYVRGLKSYLVSCRELFWLSSFSWCLSVTLVTIFPQRLILFADETVLYRSITSENDARIMQSDWANLFLWASKWNLKFNLKECWVMPFSRVTSSITFSYEVEAVTLPVATHHPYLGIEISCDFSCDFN